MKPNRFLDLLEKLDCRPFSYLKTLAGSWPRFFLSAVEQAITSYAEKRQNVEIKPVLLSIEALGDS